MINLSAPPTQTIAQPLTRHRRWLAPVIAISMAALVGFYFIAWEGKISRLAWKFLMALPILLLFSACGGTTQTEGGIVSSTPEDTSVPTTIPLEPDGGQRVNYLGVTFTFDQTLAGSVLPELAPARPAEPGPGIMWAPPEHVVFTFAGTAGSANHLYARPGSPGCPAQFLVRCRHISIAGIWPEDGETVDAQPVLQWETQPGAVNYQVVVLDNVAYPPRVIIDQTVPGPMLAVNTPLLSGHYRWTGWAHDNDGKLLAQLASNFVMAGD